MRKMREKNKIIFVFDKKLIFHVCSVAIFVQFLFYFIRVWGPCGDYGGGVGGHVAVEVSNIVDTPLSGHPLMTIWGWAFGGTSLMSMLRKPLRKLSRKLLRKPSRKMREKTVRGARKMREKSVRKNCSKT